MTVVVNHYNSKYTTLYHAAPCNTIPYHITPCDTVLYVSTLQDAVPYNTIWYHTIWNYTIWYHTVVIAYIVWGHTISHYTVWPCITSATPHHMTLHHLISHDSMMPHKTLYEAIPYHTTPCDNTLHYMRNITPHLMTQHHFCTTQKVKRCVAPYIKGKVKL